MYEEIKIQIHEDDRAQRLFLPLNEFSGQINVSYVENNGQVSAWHYHNIQTDFWCCIKGMFKVGLAIPKNDGTFEVVWEYLSEKNPRILKIPPTVYHGYQAIKPESIMMYYLTEKYDPKDEYRVEPGYFGEDWSIKSK